MRKSLIVLLVLLLALIIVIIFLISRGKTDENIEPVPLPHIKVKVLNGCGFEGAAKTASQRLIDMSIDVISSGNADAFVHKRTMIVAKKNDSLKLDTLKRLTGINLVILAINDEDYADYYIILGKDFSNYFTSNK